MQEVLKLPVIVQELLNNMTYMGIAQEVLKEGLIKLVVQEVQLFKLFKS